MVTPVRTGVFPDQTVKRGLNPDFCTFIFIKSIKFAFLSSVTAIVSITHCTVMLFSSWAHCDSVKRTVSQTADLD